MDLFLKRKWVLVRPAGGGESLSSSEKRVSLLKQLCFGADSRRHELRYSFSRLLDCFDCRTQNTFRAESWLMCSCDCSRFLVRSRTQPTPRRSRSFRRKSRRNEEPYPTLPSDRTVMPSCVTHEGTPRGRATLRGNIRSVPRHCQCTCVPPKRVCVCEMTAFCRFLIMALFTVCTLTNSAEVHSSESPASCTRATTFFAESFA